jgi:hypothetical protein
LARPEHGVVRDGGRAGRRANAEAVSRRLREGRQRLHRCSWFQAEQACALSGKRLPTNREWQRAASGTPNAIGCNVEGSVGNMDEFVADWTGYGTACENWPAAYGNDTSCYGGSTSGVPLALKRGGTSRACIRTPAVFAILQEYPDSTSDVHGDVGFRCARWCGELGGHHAGTGSSSALASSRPVPSSWFRRAGPYRGVIAARTVTR